jgi:hypothetical protein
MARTPKLGGELPAYTTMGATKPKKPRKVMAFPNPLASTGSGKNVVQRSPRENIGTPGSKNFVQRSPKVNIGTPGSKNFVQRTPDGAAQRKPGMAGLGRVMSTIRTKLSAPRKPAK